MIIVAPATHSFGTVHTERGVNATLFLGNPTFADAEWSLVHVPIPRSKQRLSQNPYNHTHQQVEKVVNCRKRDVNRKGHTDRQEKGTTGVSHDVVAFSKSGERGGWRGGVAREKAEVGAVVIGDYAAATPSMTIFAVDDPSVFEFGEHRGVAAGVKLPLRLSAACLPEDWNRFDVSGQTFILQRKEEIKSLFYDNGSVEKVPT